jgi:hypothetical protein
MNEKPLNKINNGLILGLVLFVITILLYIFDLQYNTKISLIHYLIAFAFPFFLILTLEPLKNLTVKEAITFMVQASVIGILFYSITWVLYLLFINPEFGDVIWQMQKENLLAQGIDEAVLKTKEATIRKFQSPYVMGITTFVSLTVVASISSTIAGFIKKPA